jgi:hypothetical protein
MTHIIHLPDRRAGRGRLHFDRSELSQILAIYSTQVARGEWRDYAIDSAVGLAMFSVFRHACDRALYAVAKLRGPRGVEYCLFAGPQRLVRSGALSDVLADMRRRTGLADE